MPLYEYECGQCGPFSALKKMSESSMPMTCESCGAPSARLISMPYFSRLGAAKRAAHERNEKSAHEPRAVRRSGCGCAGTHTCSTMETKATSRSKVKADAANAAGFQMQTQRTARPWMLGH